MPGYFPGLSYMMNPYMPMEMAMREQQMMGQMPFGAYNPGVYMNPMMGAYLGGGNMGNYLQSMLSMQNPQLMLPQNSGGFLGAAIGRLLGGNKGPQDPPAGAAGPQQPAQDPLVSQIYALRAQYVKAGMPIGAAQAKAISTLSTQPQYQDEQSQMILDQGMRDAQSQLGYKPSVDQGAQYQTSNFMDRNTGKMITMSELQWSELPPAQQAQYERMDNTPQIAPGRYQTYKANGKYVTTVTGPDGQQHIVATSTEPSQFIRQTAVNLTGADLKNLSPDILQALSLPKNVDAQQIDMGDQEAAVRQFDLQSQDVLGALKQGDSAGLSGDLFEHADNLIGSIGKIADVAGDTNFFDQLKNSKVGLQGVMGIVGRTKNAGANALKLNSMLNTTAYMYWRSLNPGKDPSMKDVELTRKQLIGDNADPNGIAKAIQQARITAIRNFQTQVQEFDRNGSVYHPQWYGKSYYGPGSLYKPPIVPPQTPAAAGAPGPAPTTPPPAGGMPPDIAALVHHYAK